MSTATYTDENAYTMLRLIRAASICASKDISRAPLRSVRVMPDRIVATDSYRLFEALLNFKPSSFDGSDIIITPKLITDLEYIKVPKPYTRAQPIELIFAQDDVAKLMRIDATYSNNSSILVDSLIDMYNYPTYSHVIIPETDWTLKCDDSVVAFDPTKLADLRSIEKVLGYRDVMSARLVNLPDSRKPATWQLKGPNFTINYHLMPVRIPT